MAIFGNSLNQLFGCDATRFQMDFAASEFSDDQLTGFVESVIIGQYINIPIYYELIDDLVDSFKKLHVGKKKAVSKVDFLGTGSGTVYSKLYHHQNYTLHHQVNSSEEESTLQSISQLSTNRSIAQTKEEQNVAHIPLQDGISSQDENYSFTSSLPTMNISVIKELHTHIEDFFE